MSAILPTLYLISHPRRNHPYPPSSAVSSSSRFFSSYTTSDRSPSPPSNLQLARPLAALPAPRRRHESFRLPTPYKRSCCPFITTTLATATRDQPPPCCPPFFSASSSLFFFSFRRLSPASSSVHAPPYNPVFHPPTTRCSFISSRARVTPRFSLHLTASRRSRVTRLGEFTGSGKLRVAATRRKPGDVPRIFKFDVAISRGIGESSFSSFCPLLDAFVCTRNHDGARLRRLCLEFCLPMGSGFGTGRELVENRGVYSTRLDV